MKQETLEQRAEKLGLYLHPSTQNLIGGHQLWGSREITIQTKQGPVQWKEFFRRWCLSLKEAAHEIHKQEKFLKHAPFLTKKELEKMSEKYARIGNLG